METVTDFIFLGSKITADYDCNHEIKRYLLLERKTMTNLDSVNSRNITLPTKVFIVKTMDFSSSHVSIWELDHKESWALKNWCFWNVVLEKTLESPLDWKSVLNVHWKYWCWSWNSNILAIWWEDLTHLKRPWWRERLKAGEGDDRVWDSWMASLTQWTWVWANSESQ